MGIRDKIKKIRKCSIFKINGHEKTGVVNSLVLLGSVASFFAAVEHDVNAIAGISCDANTGEITDTNLEPVKNLTPPWTNHCWSWGWGWCWSWGWSWGHDESTE